MTEARKVAALFTVKFDTEPLKKGNAMMNRTVGSLKKLAAVAGVALSVKGLTSWVNGHVDAADRVAKSADKLGIAVGTYQELSFVADRSGVSMANLADNIHETGKRIGEAIVRGSGPAVEGLRALGLSSRDLAKLSTEEQFVTLRRALSELTDETKRKTLADQLMGGGSKETLNILKMEESQFRKLREEARRRQGYTERFVNLSQDFKDVQTDVTETMKGLASTVGERLVPHFIRGAKRLEDWILRFQDFTRNTNILEAALGVLGVVLGVIAIKMAIAFAPALAFIAVIGLLVLAVDDLITGFKGGKSVIGDFVKEWTGSDLATHFENFKVIIGAVKLAFSDLSQWWNDSGSGMFGTLLGYVVDIYGWFLKMATGPARWLIDKLFGDKGLFLSIADKLAPDSGYIPMDGPRTGGAGTTVVDNRTVVMQSSGDPKRDDRRIQRTLKDTAHGKK